MAHKGKINTNTTQKNGMMILGWGGMIMGRGFMTPQ
jgi:hypothetical protein